MNKKSKRLRNNIRELVSLEHNKLLALIAVAWIIICLFFAVMGSRNKGKPDSKFDKVPIIFGLSVAGLLGILVIIGVIFF